MSIKAGQILTVAGNHLVERVQDQGLGQVRIPIDTIREVGNEYIVDQIPQEPDFTFTLNSLDVSCDFEATLHGKVGGSASAAGPAAGDPIGTEYSWNDVTAINIASPWKKDVADTGQVNAGHLVPAFTPTRVRYQMGVTENATQTAELMGGVFYYGGFAPVEDFFTGDGAQTAFATTHPAVHHRLGGLGGGTFRSVFGVLVDGQQLTEGADYTVAGGAATPGTVATVTFNTAPAAGASVRFAYFTSDAIAFPQAVHSSVIVKPGAVRGRNVVVSVASGARASGQVAGWQPMHNTQQFQIDATADTTPDREMGNPEPVERIVNSRNCTGQMTQRFKQAADFFSLMHTITGLDGESEILGWLNMNPMQVKIEIFNPRNASQILKTLYVPDAQFDIPGTPPRVNTPIDWTLTWNSLSGTYSAFKGSTAGII